MAAAAERQALIKQHNKLKMELESINAEIRKVERANEYLRRQNTNMKQMLEGPGDNMTSCANSNNGYKTSMFVEALSHAAAAGEAATEELLKHTRNIADDLAKSMMLFHQDRKARENGNIVQENVMQNIIKQAEMMVTETPSLSCKESADESLSETDSVIIDALYKPLATNRTESDLESD
ncbi:WD G-beta repeat containing protein 65, putative [Babesia ovis]|uniref:WD G-beta repeat containing protein 65, putative n=1 Tax=Babesia ovis TaxID=5869 RepID=A0A9W5WTL2_BABOV|nr:WD G-beta repeat containing protein 65, putative [Babesia ovis]